MTRMLGVFGWCETELAATAILDAQWDRPWAPVDPAIFKGDSLAQEGYRELLRSGLIAANGIPTRAFWLRVHGR